MLEPPPAAPPPGVHPQEAGIGSGGLEFKPETRIWREASQATSQPLGLMPTCVYGILKRKEKQPHVTISGAFLGSVPPLALCLNSSNAGGAVALKGSPLHEELA